MILMQLLCYCQRLSYLTALSRDFPPGMQDAMPFSCKAPGGRSS